MTLTGKMELVPYISNLMILSLIACPAAADDDDVKLGTYIHTNIYTLRKHNKDPNKEPQTPRNVMNRNPYMACKCNLIKRGDKFKFKVALAQYPTAKSQWGKSVSLYLQI